MARRTNVVLVDDLDESEAAETVPFALDGVRYEIDLSAENAEKMREAFSLYIGHGRRAAGRRSGGAGAGGRSGRRTSSSGGRGSAAEIRRWAREQGYNVPDRGRIPQAVREAYDAAH